MGVYKRKDSSYWWYNLSVKGKRYQISTKLKYTRDNKKHAEKMYYDHYDRITRLGHEEHTFTDLYNRFYNHYNKEDQRNLDKFMVYFADKKLHELTREVLNDLVDHYAIRRKASTVNRVFNTLRSILNKANKELGWLTAQPYIKKLKEEEYFAKVLTREEEERLLHYLPDYIKTIVDFSLLTGLRIGTVTNLTWDMLDYAKRRINIPVNIVKNKKPRSIPIQEQAWDIILRQEPKGIYPHIFKYNGKPVKNANKTAWKTALKKAGIKGFRFHDLRHTWTTRMLENGVSIDTVTFLGGWSDYKMVLHYGAQRQVDVSGIDGYK